MVTVKNEYYPKSTIMTEKTETENLTPAQEKWCVLAIYIIWRLLLTTTTLRLADLGNYCNDVFYMIKTPIDEPNTAIIRHCRPRSGIEGVFFVIFLNRNPFEIKNISTSNLVPISGFNNS